MDGVDCPVFGRNTMARLDKARDVKARVSFLQRVSEVKSKALSAFLGHGGESVSDNLSDEFEVFASHGIS